MKIVGAHHQVVFPGMAHRNSPVTMMSGVAKMTDVFWWSTCVLLQKMLPDGGPVSSRVYGFRV